MQKGRVYKKRKKKKKIEKKEEGHAASCVSTVRGWLRKRDADDGRCYCRYRGITPTSR